MNIRTAESMEPVLLQSFLSSDLRIDGVVRDILRNGAMKRRVEERNRIRVGELLDAGFNNR